MGIRDSSKTRVNPIFNHLLATDPTGASWLDGLYALGSRDSIVRTVPRGLRLIENHGRRWGDKESSLPAPQALLEFLVQNVDAESVKASSSSESAREKRAALARREQSVVEEALESIRAKKRGSEWFILEGSSKPDALLESGSTVLCVEGKRTESECTTETTWMKKRSQLVRHMDAASEAFPNKRVYGLLIVEGDGGSTAIQPSEYWIAQCASQFAQTMLDQSLPHRSTAERSRIADGILGVTTWQALCAKLGPHWSSVPDTVNAK